MLETQNTKDVRHFIFSVIINVNILITSILFYLIYLLIFPITPFKLFGPDPVKTKKVIAGQLLIYTTRYCRYIDGKGVVNRSLVDSLIYVLPEVPSLNQPKGCGTKDIIMTIPKDVPSGKYHVHIKGTFQVNPIRNYVVEVDTEQFEVINASDEAGFKVNLR